MPEPNDIVEPSSVIHGIPSESRPHDRPALEGSPKTDSGSPPEQSGTWRSSREREAERDLPEPRAEVAPPPSHVFTTADLPIVSIDQSGDPKSLLWQPRRRRRKRR